MNSIAKSVLASQRSRIRWAFSDDVGRRSGFSEKLGRLDTVYFDHFNVYLLDKKTNRLHPLMVFGMPADIVDYELYASTTGNGISGYVGATGRSYICHDVQNDPRYLPGLDWSDAARDLAA